MLWQTRLSRTAAPAIAGAVEYINGLSGDPEVILLILPAHPAAILVFVTHMMLRNAVGHSGYEFFPADRDGKPLFDWMTTVTHHDLHHAHAGYNLGLYFTWWDRWMGTEHPNYLERLDQQEARARAIKAARRAARKRPKMVPAE